MKIYQSVTLAIILGGISAFYLNDSKQTAINNMLIAKTQFAGQFLPESFSEESINNILGHYEKNRRTREVYHIALIGDSRWHTLITGADYDSFTAVDLNWARDKNHYYYSYEKTDLLTQDHPRVVGAGGYIVDDHNVYNGGGMLLSGIDRKSFQLLGDSTPYAKDKNHIYITSTILTGVDYDSFKGLNRLYAKDKNNIYIGKNIVTGADIASFESLKSEMLSEDRTTILYDAKDKNHYYVNGTISVL